MSYQSFPWAQGDSVSPAKLIALDLPKLEGKSFLDVGCNAGFFCGFADWQGAKRVVGIDSSEGFLATARELFPRCEFICKDWSNLGEDKFDVIIFLSAIHYAPDQQAMLDLLMDRLKPGGVLVLEIGIAPGAKNEFVEVKRSIDSRFFPTQKKLESMFEKYAYKHIAQSVPQAGDPVPRHVFHVRRRQPVAILFMDAPHSGKTTISTSMFRQDLFRVSGDLVYYEIMNGQRGAPEAIREIINEWRTGDVLNCAAITFKILRSGLLGNLCEIIRAETGDRDFILDMYVSPPGRERMRAWWEANGFFVVDVALCNSRSHPHEKAASNAEENCRRYLEYLQKDFLVNEDDYLAANPDVAHAITRGRIPNAQYHYWNFGRREGRPLTPEK